MKTNKFILYFIIKAIGLYLLWYFIYDLWLKKSGEFDNWIVDKIVYTTYTLLTFLNYNLNVDNHVIGIHSGSSNVFVASGCNGLELYILFAGFVLIFEGSWKHKTWFIPLGVIIIYFFNVLRVAALVINGFYSRELLDFNHKYTYTILMYILTFMGWMIWVKYFANIKKKGNDSAKVI